MHLWPGLHHFLRDVHCDILAVSSALFQKKKTRSAACVAGPHISPCVLLHSTQRAGSEVESPAVRTPKTPSWVSGTLVKSGSIDCDAAWARDRVSMWHNGRGGINRTGQHLCGSIESNRICRSKCNSWWMCILCFSYIETEMDYQFTVF